MIKHDPDKLSDRSCILIVGAALVAILIVSNLLIALLEWVGYSNWLAILLVILLLLIQMFCIFMFLTVLLSFYAENYAENYAEKCLNHRRNRAVQKGLFATEQPVPDETALITPITIQLRPSRLLLLRGGAVVIGAATMILLVVEAVLSMTLHLQFPLPLTAIAIGIFFVPLTRFILQVEASFGENVHIDEQGITVTSRSIITTRVDWRTARLFTLNASKFYRVYELINDETAVRWYWPLNSHPLLLYQPVIPQEQYDQQMQALLALVAVKTGLPLYDISEPQKQPAQFRRDLRD